MSRRWWSTLTIVVIIGVAYRLIIPHVHGESKSETSLLTYLLKGKSYNSTSTRMKLRLSLRWLRKTYGWYSDVSRLRLREPFGFTFLKNGERSMWHTILD